MDTRTDEQVKAEYDRINGIGAKDYGSRAVILRDVRARAKRKGYRTSGFSKMGRNQLFAIAQKLDGGCGE
jgi:hypothetical protein